MSDSGEQQPKIPAPSETTSASWIAGPVRDLLIGCGAWSAPLMALTFFASKASFVFMGFLFYLLAMFCNNPHYMATLYRAYGTRATVSKYRFFTIYVTAIMFLTTIVIHFKPALLPVVFSTYIFWSPWHYSGQNFGLTMMMARRNGINPTGLERRLLSLSFIAAYALWILTLNTQSSEDFKLLTLGISSNAAAPFQVFLALVFFSFVSYVSYKFVRRTSLRAMTSTIVLLSTQCIWFVLPGIIPVFFPSILFNATYHSAGILAFMHCAQYLWITAYYAKRESFESKKGSTKKWDISSYYLTLIIGGIALFIPGPWIVSTVFHFDLLESLFIFMAIVNIHHFILDGAIWKLRDGKIARLLISPIRSIAPKTEIANESISKKELETISPGTKRTLKVCAAVLILSVGILDQYQHHLTQNSTSPANLDLAQRINSNDSRVFFRRAKLLLEKGEPMKALEQIERTIAINPNSIQSHRLKAQILVRLDKIEEALAQYEYILSTFRPIAGVHINAGVFAQNLGKTERAHHHYQEAFRLDPGNTEIHLYLGEFFQFSGDLKRAIEHYETYLKESKKIVRSSNEDDPIKLLAVKRKLAYAYKDSHELDKALFLFKGVAVDAESRKQLPITIEAFQNIEWILRQLKRYEEADQMESILVPLREQLRREMSGNVPRT